MPNEVDLVFANQALVAEVIAHNCGVIVRRRHGESWDAPENQYRNALTELRAQAQAA